MAEEKTRAFDDEVDLNVREGQAVQLVSWIRFHRIYQSGSMHVRYLSRRACHIILVMPPDNIVVTDTSCDIQTMSGNENAPEIVKQLLEPFISPEESSRYVVLFCDGLKWELLRSLALDAQETPTTQLPANDFVAGPESLEVKHEKSPEQTFEPKVPEPLEVTEEQHKEECIISHVVQPADISNVVEHQRKEVKEKLSRIKDKLYYMIYGNIHHTKTNYRTVALPIALTEPSLISHELSSPASISSRNEACPTHVISYDDNILPQCDTQPDKQSIEESDGNKWNPSYILSPSTTLGHHETVSSDEPVEEISGALVESFSVSVSEEFANQQIEPSITQSDLFPNCKLNFPLASHQQMEETEPTSPQEATPPSEKCFFPNVVMAEIISVQSECNATLKIKLEEITDRNQQLCPNGAIMLLPLPNIDDMWGIVALDHVPQCGFQIPGVSVYIPFDVLGRAALTAVERKTRVAFPINYQTKSKDTTLKPCFSVYGNPQLPRHVFVGPFPSKHVKKWLIQPYINIITTTKLVEFNSVGATEPITSTVSSEENLTPEVVLPAYTINNTDEQTASSKKNVALVATMYNKNPTWESDLPNAIETQLAVENHKIELKKKKLMM